MSIAAALTLAGCSNNDMETDGRLLLTSGVEGQESRAFTPTQSTLLSDGETVNVWVFDKGNVSETPIYQNNKLTANGGTGLIGGEAMYFPKNGDNINIYAIHGSFVSPLATAFPKSGVNYKVESDQSVVFAPGNYTRSDLLYACEKNVPRTGSTTTKQLTFYHMLSKLELAIRLGTGVSQLAATNAVTLSSVKTTGKFTPADGDLSTQAFRKTMLSPVAAAPDVAMNLGKAVSTNFAEGLVYNEAILVPQEMKDKVLTFNLVDYGQLKYTIPPFSGKTTALFEGGKKYRYQITLTAAGIQVTAQIVDWEEEPLPVEGNAAP